MLTSQAPVISMRDVNHYYGAGALRRRVLFDLTCDIWPGEIVIMTGPSGSGKTTVLTLAGALRSVQHGSMKILGEELNGARTNSLVRIRENIGFIFQQHNLLDGLTALQNVELALGVKSLRRKEARVKSSAILQAVGLGDRMVDYPSRLSGGQRQRVAIARALVRRPKIILADEPTAALDKQSGRDVVELLRQLARRDGCAVLLVTHDNRILDTADRLMQLEDGRLGSFEAATSPHATHLLTALACMPDSRDLQTLLNCMNEREFLEVLKGLGAECEQFLNVLDMGDRDSIRLLLRNLLDLVFGKISILLAAQGAALLAIRKGGLQTVLTHGDINSIRPDVAERAAARGEIVNVFGDDEGRGVDSILCVPIRGRNHRCHGIAQLVNKRGGGGFTAADERTFWDFSGPLGLLLESCERISPQGPAANVWGQGAT